MKLSFPKISKRYLKVFAIRWMIVNIIFFLVKLTLDHKVKHDGAFHPQAVFYYFSAFFLLMTTWELNDWLIRKYAKNDANNGLNVKSGMRILAINTIVCIPLIAIVYYVGIFEFGDLFKIETDNPWLRFRIDFFRAIVLGLSAILFNMFSFALNQKRELEHKMNRLEKEALTSKYKSLKSQISPHFLFNSLNTLTSLMYEDRDLASDFVSRLASCYRYILDNREEDLVSLEKELHFLDSFIFMMKVRHEGALTIKSDITIEPRNFSIPTLTLQMLVENALKHNYYSKEKPLLITISSNSENSIQIQNNIQVRTSEEESTKLGLKNIKNRYAFYTTDKVIVTSDERHFTVTIPLLSKDIKEISIIKAS
ncbi:sensor histidine kinase [Tenacibaculum sp. 190524A05c]